MRKIFYGLSTVIFILVAVASTFHLMWLSSLIIILPVFILGVLDVSQKRRAVRRNFPVVGNFRYWLEAIRPELQQYFVESNHSGRPINRELRSVIYQRAKGQLQTKAFGTQMNVYEEHHEWVNHSMLAKKIKPENMRVNVGGPHCEKPYSSNMFNSSAMSYGALSRQAIESINRAAKEGEFYHNTGEGGISQHHQHGGDLVWQIGTAYFGCRTDEGKFCPEKFKEKANRDEVKMIEIKLSQGAKPGKGGMLPGEKVTKEIADIRGVKIGETVISPPSHEGVKTPNDLINFIVQLRDLSGGKPVGIKLCVGQKSEFIALCKAMVKRKNGPDFITVDGAEGGTGAAPLEFVNSVGTPLNDGLAFVHDCLIGFGLRENIKIIASGKVFTSFHLLTKLALGADLVNSGRGMMLALGCIHALLCNSNRCPVGVATTDLELGKGLYVPNKTQRVQRYQSETITALFELLGAMGYDNPSEVTRKDVFKRMTNENVMTYEELYPSVLKNSMNDHSQFESLSDEILEAIQCSTDSSFKKAG